MRVTVRYFALLREQSGLTEEVVQSSASNLEDLYEELRARHGFKLGKSSVRPSVNGEFVPYDQLLKEGDEVVFIPPVAGG